MRRSSSLGMLVGVFILSLPVQEPLSGQIGLEEVTSLRFRGNSRFPDEVLATAINTRETECRSFLFKLIPFCRAGADFSLDPYFLSEREFRRDHARVRLFYFLRGFRETVVDTIVNRSTEDEVQITFQIQEGEPIQVVEVNFPGVEELADSSVLDDLPIRVGEPLSMVALDASRDTLETRFRNRGFAHVEVMRRYFIPTETPHEAQVWFELYPGPLTRFGTLTVGIIPAEGREASVDENVVRRMLPFREGDLYQEDIQFAGQRNLYNLDIFSFVELRPDTLLAVDSILPFTIRVQEDDLHRVRTGGGLGTAECFNFESSWNSLNFFGGARRLQVTGRVANVLGESLQSTPLCRQAGTGDYGGLTYLISADFTQPWFFSPRNSIAASVFAERQSVPPIFVREAVGMSLGLNRTLAVSTLLGFSFRPEFSSLDAAEVFFCSVYLICTHDEIALLQEAQRLFPVGISFSQDRRNQPLSPTLGYSAVVDMEYAGDWTGSEFRYTRLLSEATWYTSGRTHWVLGARLRGGWVRPEGFQDRGQNQASSEILHPEKRLFAGGSNSVRGYAQNRLGPQVLYLEKVDSLLWHPDTGEPYLCTPEEIMDQSCDAGGLDDSAFLSRPKGGTRLLEGSLELRFPVSGPRWEGATFLDFGQVWDEDATVALRDLEFTPGMGIRYFSPIGPIRVDLAYRFGGGTQLPVVTQAIEPFDSAKHTEDQRLKGPNGEILPYAVPGDLALLNPLVLWGEKLGPWNLRRFQLHFSIGQAF
jgi:outer membrane protein insertion porin family